MTSTALHGVTPRGWTRLGTLDGPGEPIVDHDGIVQVAPGSPSIEWWIAGDDRWYLPAHEHTVRQSLHHNTPVVETRMRIKGGDVCLRTFAVTVPSATGLRDVVVAEIENTTGVPCGAAFAVRPAGVVGDAPIGRVTIDGGVVRADGAPVLILPREPAGALAGRGADEDLADRARRGEATASSFAAVSCPDGAAEAVVVVPLAHRNTFRVVLPVPEPDGTFDAAAHEYPAAVPPADNVARGWRTQVRDLARVRVADPRLQAVCDAAAPWLSATTNSLLAPIGRSVWDTATTPRWQHVAAVAGALDRIGLHERSGVLLARAAAIHGDDPVGDASWLVEAFGGHLARTRDEGFAGAVADTCARAVASIEAGRVQVPAWRRRRVLLAASTVFTSAGERSAAAAAVDAARSDDGAVGPRGLAGDTGRSGRCGELFAAQYALEGGDGAGAWAVLDRYLDEVTSTGVWAEDASTGANRHDVGVTAAVACLAYDLFASASDGNLRCIARVPDAWLGTSLEATGISTPSGTVGYTVRWHADRPALLWECSPSSEGAVVPADLSVTAPGLDPSWVGVGASGEALLGAHDLDEKATAGGSRISGLQIGPSRGGS
jgi:hypothetical protein